MLEVTDLACLRGDRMLFADVSLTVASGELVRIAGPNGVGKTSLLRLLCGLAVPEHGVVRWKGERIACSGSSIDASLVAWAPSGECW